MPGYAIPDQHSVATLGAVLLVLLAAGLSLPALGSLALARALAWLLTALAVTGTHLALAGAPHGNRMLALVAVLLLGMKAVVHVEHTLARGRPRLAPLAYFRFAVLSLGMRPGPRHRRRRTLVPALACLLAGAVALGLARTSENSLLLLVGLSLTVHFGIANLGAATTGQPPLFKNPLRSKNLADFWSRRWNLGYVEMMTAAVRRPLAESAANRFATPVVFLASGLFHEIAITLPVGEGYGLPTLYFMTHGFLATLTKHQTWPAPLTAIALLVPLPLLFPLPFIHGVLWPIVAP